MLLTVEELAINDLKEPVHHWVRTYEFNLTGKTLGIPLSHVPPRDSSVAGELVDEYNKIYDLLVFFHIYMVYYLFIFETRF